MALPTDTGASASADNGSAQPTTSDNAQTQNAINVPKEQYDSLVKSQENLKKVQEYFGANRRLVDFAHKYASDENAKKLVDGYLEGKINLQNNAQDQNKQPDTALNDFEPTQREAITKMVEQLVKERLAPVDQEISHLRNYYAQSQIDKFDTELTTNAGYPVNFKDVKEEIANKIQRGEANDARSAFFQLVGDQMPKIRKEQDKAILDIKRQSSMSRYSSPAKMPTKPSANSPRSFQEALVQAEEALGVVLSDKL